MDVLTPQTSLAHVDHEIFMAIENEDRRQHENLELIASENYASAAVREAMASVMTNKYAEGYPGKRYYGGCEFVDVAESLAIDAREEASSAPTHANVQPHSGAQANMAVFMAVLEPGDTVLGMSLAHGGHLTHGTKVNFCGKLYNASPTACGATPSSIDFDEMRALAREHKPKMIIAGASAYPRTHRLRAVSRDRRRDRRASSWSTWRTSPASSRPACIRRRFRLADFVTSTTHKTLRGPRGGFILMHGRMRAQAIDKSVFPGIQGGPLMHMIAAKAVAFDEALQPEFKSYQQQVLDQRARDGAGARARRAAARRPAAPTPICMLVDSRARRTSPARRSKRTSTRSTSR